MVPRPPRPLSVSDRGLSSAVPQAPRGGHKAPGKPRVLAGHRLVRRCGGPARGPPNRPAIGVDKGSLGGAGVGGAVAIWAPGAPGAVQGEAKGSCWRRPRSQGRLSWWLRAWPARPYSVPTDFPIAETKAPSHLSHSSLTLHVHPPPSPGSSQISQPVRKPPAPQLPPWAEALSQFTWPQGSLLSHLGPLPPPAASGLPVSRSPNRQRLPGQLESCLGGLVHSGPSWPPDRSPLPSCWFCVCPPSSEPAQTWSCSGLSSTAPSSRNSSPHSMTGYLLSFRFQPSVPPPFPKGPSDHPS